MDIVEEINSNWSEQELNLIEVRDRLKQQADVYRDMNGRLKDVFEKLNLLREDLSLECVNELKKLSNIQEIFQTKDCSQESLNFSQTDQQRKKDVYIAKVKTCRKMYINLNEKLSKEIKRLKSEFELSKDKVNDSLHISNDDITAHEVKIKRYEEQLSKFEEKYPWIKKPEFSLHNISKEMHALNNLKQRKIELLQELEVYQGLSPDLVEARQQLNDIKKNYEELNKSFHYNNMKKF